MSKRVLPTRVRPGLAHRRPAACSPPPVALPFEDNPNCERVLRMFALFGNEYRFKILCLLARGEACVRQIVDGVGSRYSNVSQQLKMLTLAGYLSKERRKKQTFYRLESADIREVLAFLESRYGVEQEGEE
jgi:ArsR family transcriptional regulator